MNIFSRTYKKLMSTNTKVTQPDSVFQFSHTEVERILKDSAEKQDTVFSQMAELRNAIVRTQKLINTNLDEIRNDFIKYQTAVDFAYYGESIYHLTKLHRQMVQANLKGTEPFQEYLKSILVLLGLEEIKPAPGEKYDPIKQDKQNQNRKGCIISECLNSGWQRGSEIILRAIVNVRERNEE